MDADPQAREYLKDIANRLGLPCAAVADGEAALALLEASMETSAETSAEDSAEDSREISRTVPVTWVCFVDWKAPGRGALALTRQIKEGREDLSVVLMAPFAAWNGLEAEAKQAGVAMHLSKPLFPSAVAASIAECLGVKKARPADQTQGKEVKFTGCRLLLAEDVEINREILTELLKPTELEIVCAENGIEAVALFGAPNSNFDLILMDLQMPEQDGYEATQRIRELEAASPGSRIPIIAMTANVFQEDIDKCLQAGMDGHLGKPIDLDAVLAVLRQYLTATADAR